MKILIIDDSEKKQEEIKECVLDVFGEQISLKIVDNITDAKKSLLNHYFDICFLDIQIPRRNKGLIEKDGGIKLLKEIKINIDFKNPELIIITSEYDESIKQIDLEKSLNYIVKYDRTSSEWEDMIKERLIIEKRIKKQREEKIKKANKKRIALFAIHGMNTRGEWKNELAAVTNEYRPEITCYLWDYGNFKLKIFNYFARKKVISEFAKFYETTLYGKDYEKVYLVAHSFGTYITFKCLEKFQDIKFDKIIFMGSPLKSNTDWYKNGAYKKFNKLYFYKSGNDFVIKHLTRCALLGKSGVEGFEKTPDNIKYIDVPGAGHSDGFSKLTIKNDWLDKYFK